MGLKMRLLHIFISSITNSKLFKGIYRPVLLKRKSSEVVPQDYLVRVSLKSGYFVLCFAHLGRYLAFMWLALHLHSRIIQDWGKWIKFLSPQAPGASNEQVRTQHHMVKRKFPLLHRASLFLKLHHLDVLVTVTSSEALNAISLGRTSIQGFPACVNLRYSHTSRRT